MSGNDKCDELNAAACLPLCAEPERPSASRHGLFGVVNFDLACRTGGDFCFASRISTPPAAAGIRDRDL